MEESTLKTVDAQGRVLIPAEWRKDWKTDKVILTRDGDEIKLKPIKSVSIETFFDSIIVEDDTDFTDPHSIERAGLRKVIDEIHRC